VFAARGDVFTAPAKEGSIRNITRTSGIREKLVSWSPDGRWVAYISDRTGEDEVYIAPNDGLGKERQITSGYQGFKFQPVWSPDSKKIAWGDKDTCLWYADITDKRVVEVDRGKHGEIQNYSWSPDSRWLAYDKNADNFYSFVNLYSLVDRKITAVTTSMTNSFAPIFDPDGKYLYFLSDRDFNEVLGNIDFEFANPKTTRVYIATLRKDEPSPFPALSDEAEVKETKKEEPIPTPVPPPAKKPTKKEPKPEDKAKEKPKDEDKDQDKNKDKESKDKATEKPKEFRIDLDGIQNRIVALPTEPGLMRTLAAAKGFIYYSTTPIQGLSGPLPGESSVVHAYDLKERKNKALMEQVERFALSFDGSKLLYEAEGSGGGHSYGIIDAKPEAQPKKIGDGALSLSSMRSEVDPPGMEADLQRSLAPGTRLLFRSCDERSGLGKDSRQVCSAAALRRRPLQLDLHYGRDDW